MKNDTALGKFIKGFFTKHLIAQKGVSANTVTTYGVCMKMFLNFACSQLQKRIDQLVIDDLSDNLALKFLNHLENERENASRSRNSRLAVLKCFFRFLAEKKSECLLVCQRVCAIAEKKFEHKAVEYLEDDELRALLNSIRKDSLSGLRDYALLLLLYNTGARVQKIVDLKISDIDFQYADQIKLVGKGKRQRLVPLWRETLDAIKNYLEIRKPKNDRGNALFLNSNNASLSRFGVRHIINKYKKLAEDACPKLKNKAISPHSFRHTAAIHLIQAGNDISVVKAWLGHANINTTSEYIEIDMRMKREALDKCRLSEQTLSKANEKERCKWMNEDVIKWLENLSIRKNIM